MPLNSSFTDDQYPDFPQGQFEPEWFDQLLNGPLSYRVQYERASQCPCEAERDNGPDPRCPICHGIGFYWTTPTTTATINQYEETFYRDSITAPERLVVHSGVTIQSVTSEYGQTISGLNVTSDGRLDWASANPSLEYGTAYTVTYTAPMGIRAGLYSITSLRKLLDRGIVQMGDISCSIPRHLADLTTDNPAWHANAFDLFTPTDLQKPYQQKMVRGQKDTLTYQHYRTILDARALIGSSIVHYAFGTDFVINNGKVVWLTSGPPVGTPFILDYEAAPTYYIFPEMLQLRHVNGDENPRRVGLRLFEVFPNRKPQ